MVYFGIFECIWVKSHAQMLVAYFRAKFQVCGGALTSRVKQL
jgi:hypothetical protein